LGAKPKHGGVRRRVRPGGGREGSSREGFPSPSDSAVFLGSKHAVHEVKGGEEGGEFLMSRLTIRKYRRGPNRGSSRRPRRGHRGRRLASKGEIRGETMVNNSSCTGKLVHSRLRLSNIFCKNRKKNSAPGH